SAGRQPATPPPLARAWPHAGRDRHRTRPSAARRPLRTGGQWADDPARRRRPGRSTGGARGLNAICDTSRATILPFAQTNRFGPMASDENRNNSWPLKLLGQVTRRRLLELLAKDRGPASRGEGLAGVQGERRQ